MSTFLALANITASLDLSEVTLRRSLYNILSNNSFYTKISNLIVTKYYNYILLLPRLQRLL